MKTQLNRFQSWKGLNQKVERKEVSIGDWTRFIGPGITRETSLITPPDELPAKQTDQQGNYENQSLVLSPAVPLHRWIAGAANRDAVFSINFCPEHRFHIPGTIE